MTHTHDTLHARAILVKPSLPQWLGKVKNAAVTKSTLNAHGASDGAGNWTSTLIPKTASTQRQRDAGEEDNAFTALISHMSAVRNWSYANTLPWTRDGYLLLPIANHSTYTTYWRIAHHKFNELMDVLVADWRELVRDSKRLLNGSCPPNAKWPEDIRREFDFSIEFAPVPSGGDFRVELTADEIKILASSTEARVKETAQAAQDVAVKRLFEVLDKIHSTLAKRDPKRADGMQVFHDTLIENARDMCDVLQRLNIADDERLEKFRRETEALATTDPEVVRKNLHVRAATADKAKAILTDMTTAFGKGIFG